MDGDMDRSWCSLGTLCGARDWSTPRLLHELESGLGYRTIPAGYTIDWRHPEVRRSLDLEAGTVMIVQTVLMADGVPDIECRIVGVEVLSADVEAATKVPPPADVEVMTEVLSPADIVEAEAMPWTEAEVLPSVTVASDFEILPPGEVLPPTASARWALATVRDLQANNKIPKGARKADLARLLEGEAEKAVKAGQITRALKATYIENQLTAWGIWPLMNFLD
jgi:hypothetical protein